MMINSYHYIGSMHLIIFCILYLTICCWDALFGKDYYCNATYLYKCLYLFLVTVLWFAVFGGHLQSILKLYFFQNISFNCSITLKDSIAHLEKMWSYVMLYMCIVTYSTSLFEKIEDYAWWNIATMKDFRICYIFWVGNPSYLTFCPMSTKTRVFNREK